MLPPPPLERITLPAPTEPAARPPFPWVATLAPVAVSLALWAFTQSVFSLVFALLGPLVAAGGVLDGARSRRRTARAEEKRLRAGIDRAEARIGEAHERERQRLSSLIALPAGPRWDGGHAGPVPVRVGTGDAPPVVAISGESTDDPAVTPIPALAALREAVLCVPGAALLVDAADGIGIVGPPVLAAATARAIALQVAARLSPAVATVTAPTTEDWITGLPHHSAIRDGQTFAWTRGDAPAVTIAWAEHRDGLPLGCAVLLDVSTSPHAITSAQAARGAGLLTERAELLGERRAAAGLPDRCALADLLDAARGAGLSATIGSDATGPVGVDLIAQGPHALIAGTTGSGKSELLVSWVLSMAHGRSPDLVSFLLIDFKGGAAFAPLAGLPHVLATLSDLDARLTRRAVESLRAELLRRERLLADRGARAIDDLPPGALSRLVIVVDEFAAVVAASPELHEVFADLAARGRSLGLHLVLCTQRPAGVVRDAVLANIGLRISLRVPDRGDSIAMLGDDSAARLPAQPRGRAILLADGGVRTIQVALASSADCTRIADATPPGGAVRPWCDPLPGDLDLDELAPVAQGLAFGLSDLPAEQRQPTAAHDPARHGHLLAIGAAGSGLTSLLTTLAESARRAGMPVQVLAGEPADAWAQLSELAVAPQPCLLLIDDLDALLSRIDADYRHELIELLTTILRDPGAASPFVVVTMRRLTGPLAGIAGLFGSRLLLRQASREDHVLAGGATSAFDLDRPPGAGEWRGVPIQAARASGATLPAAQVPPPVPLTLASHPVIAMVAARPREHLQRLRDAGARVLQLGSDALPDAGLLHVASRPTPTVLLGDPDAWQADWALLTTARREWPIVLTGCAPADHRALLRDRDLPPLLGSRPGECWLAHEGRTVRAVLRIDPEHPQHTIP
ncbi:MAG TPA: FtsK/SpoIIIE domain-containing protein [Pseudolysinimonas sp.]|nr:FtsK/SpoIIIE domain-containing protein [Pseudolysinimonas sp.]